LKYDPAPRRHFARCRRWGHGVRPPINRQRRGQTWSRFQLALVRIMARGPGLGKRPGSQRPGDQERSDSQDDADGKKESLFHGNSSQFNRQA
jgi:hypothetical protein